MRQRVTQAVLCLAALTMGVPPRGVTRPARADGQPQSPAVAMFQSLKKSVFRLEVVGADGTSASTGAGFVAGPDGAAITNYHVVQGAVQAFAVVEPDGRRVPVELWAVAPERDLAALKLRPEGAPLDAPPLPLAEGEPLEGTDVWAVGYPEGLGYSVTKGIVNGVRTFGQLPEGLRAGLQRDPRSRWVQTDCTLNPGNSGGPLVDGAGRVVAVNTLAWTKGANLYFAVSARHAGELLGALPEAPITFGKAPKPEVRQLSLQHPNGGIWPEVDLPATAPASGVMAAASRARIAMQCPSCRGEGKVRHEVRTGYAYVNGVRRAITKTTEEPCRVCGGTGFAKPRAVQAAVERLADVVARVPRSDGELELNLRSGAQALREAVGGNPGLLMTALNGDLARQLADPATRPGAAIVFVGVLAPNPQVTDPKARVYRILRADNKTIDDTISLVVVDPLTVGAPMGPTLIGGVLAGYHDGPDGKRSPVIQRGFAIALQ